jgi:hypothetical protein
VGSSNGLFRQLGQTGFFENDLAQSQMAKQKTARNSTMQY